MNSRNIIKYAKILNWMEVAATLILFIAFRYTSSAVKNLGYGLSALSELESLVRIENGSRIVCGIISVVVIVGAAVLMSKNTEKVKGVSLVLASGILSLVFAIIGFVLGIVVWILVGASMSQMKKWAEEDHSYKDNVNVNEFGQAAVSDSTNYNAQTGTFEENNQQF